MDAPRSSERPPPRRLEAALICGVFFLLLALPLALNRAGLGREYRILRDSEFRQPARQPQRPRSWAAAGLFPAQWDAYWRDAFPFRGRLIQLQAAVRHRFLRANGRLSIFLDDGFVCDLETLDRYRGRITLDDRKLDAFIELLRRKRRFFEEAGIAYYFVFPPSRIEFHRDRFPAALRLPAQHHLLARILARMPAEVRQYVIVTDDAMRTAHARHPDRRLFYRRDHHWSDWGRTVGAAEIVRFLRRDFPELPPLDPDAVPFVLAPEGREYWYDLRRLGVPFESFPEPRIEKAAPAWADLHARLAAEPARRSLRMLYVSDSFMIILSAHSPEILSFAVAERRQIGFHKPALARRILPERPDIVLESICVEALTSWGYLEKNRAWLRGS